MANHYDIIVYNVEINEQNHNEKVISDLTKVLSRLIKRKPLIINSNDLSLKEINTQDTSVFLLFLSNSANITLPANTENLLKIYLQKNVNEPEEVKNAKGYFFGSDQQDNYWMNMVNLAYEIQSMITTIRSTKKDINLKNIFFPITAPENLIFKDILKAEFLKHSFYDIEEKKDSYINTSTDDLIKKADAYVTLFPTEKELSDKEKDKLYNQLQLISGDTSGKNHFIWLNPKSDYHNDAFLSKIKAEGLIENAEVVQNPIEIFKSIVIRILSDSGSSNKKDDKALENLVYIIHETGNNEIQNLSQELTKHGKNIVNTNDILKSKKPVLEHRDMLVKCNHIIILYDRDNRAWLLSKLNDLMKTKGYGKSEAFKSKHLLLKDTVDILNTSISNDVNTIKYSNTIDKNIVDMLSIKQ